MYSIVHVLELVVMKVVVVASQLIVHDKFKNDIGYSVKLPVKEFHPILPDNYGLSLCRLKSLKRGLSNDKIFLPQYDQVFQEQLKVRINEDVKLNGKVESVVYLPRKEVNKSDTTTTKVRAILDTSAKKKDGVSLNDGLCNYLCLNPELYKLLLQF